MTAVATRPAISPARRATMRAAVLAAPGAVRLEEVPIPEPGPGQVRVRLEGCGVCGSNSPVWEGRDWFTYPLEPGKPGHEGYGRIDALGPGVRGGPQAGLAVGQRVGILSYAAFAEYDVAPAENVIPLPPSMDDQPFPAEALGCAVNVFRRSGIQKGHTVAVVGFGFLGALVAQQARAAGATVIPIGRRRSSLDAARRMGMEGGLAPGDHKQVIDEVSRRTAGRFCDVVVEAAGAQQALDLSAELTRERGRLVIAGFHQDGPRSVNMFLWNWRGLDVINAHERDPAVYIAGMRAAAEQVADGTLDPSPLYTHRFPLGRLADALDAARARPDGFMKAIVTMGDPR
jgi:threonine dehydrogenase-like Zn-dependent dehydrogenase